MYGKYTLWGAILFLLVLISIPLQSTASHCTIFDVTSSQDCIGPVSGNDDASWFNSYGGTGAFGINQWMYAQKLEVDDPPTLETVIDVGLNVTFDPNGGGLSGTWSLNSNVFDLYQKIAFALKAGPEFSAYHLLDGSSTSGIWDISGWTSHELSHFTVYVTAIPVPAAMWLFVSGLVGLVALNRRRMFA
jgi:hypothetical protein